MKLRFLVDRIVAFLIIGASICVAAGCAPRGESRTVEQILTDARSAYQSASASFSGDVSPALKSLSGALDRLAGIGGAGDAKLVSQEISTMLVELSGRIGYTSRAAMAELIEQYRTISQSAGSSVSIGAPNLKLLAARTYSLVTSELTTTKFKIS